MGMAGNGLGEWDPLNSSRVDHFGWSASEDSSHAGMGTGERETDQIFKSN